MSNFTSPLATATTTDFQLQQIAEKVQNNVRLTPADGLYLFEKAPLGWLGALANEVRERKHGHRTYFNRNFHIEPTNVCVFSCKF